MQVKERREVNVLSFPLLNRVDDELSNPLVLGSPPDSIYMAVILLANRKCVDSSIPLRKEMWLKHLHTEPLLCLPFTENHEMFRVAHGNGPAPTTLRCHNSPIE